MGRTPARSTSTMPSARRGVAAAAAGATVLGVTGGLPAGAAGAAEAPRVEHCVLRIVGQEPNGRFITEEPVCYPTLAEALGAAGAPVPARRSSGGLTAAELDGAVQAASTTLGIHFDGAGRTGSSITVSGGACNGGYVNLSASWTNRISSTLNSCAVVNFWDGFDKTGSYESTGVSTVNLGGLDNAANSVGYAS